jgi:hypothetical protein
MRAVLTHHALQQMARRAITASDVDNALANYHTRLPTPQASICYIGPG